MSSDAMRLTRFEDARQFSERALPYLVRQEAKHNLILGLCSTLIQDNPYEQPPYLAVVEREGEVVAAALRTPPHNLNISDVRDEAALDLILEDVRAVYSELPGVVGPKEVAHSFSRRWSARTGSTYQVDVAERAYQLEHVIPVMGVPGEMRRAQPEDRDLLIDWFVSFSHVTPEPVDHSRAAKMVDIRMNSAIRGLVIWWDDDTPVSMAGYAGPTPNGIRVGPVYTPPELRGRGYASACVAALSQWLLDDGRRYVFLFTDLSNPTANHIYQAIGYVPMADVDMIRFLRQASGGALNHGR